MIQHGILDLDSIYGLLGPEDEAIFGDADTEKSDALEFVRKMNIVRYATIYAIFFCMLSYLA